MQHRMKIPTALTAPAALTALTALTALLGAGSAAAQDAHWYAGALLGVTGQSDQRLSLDDGVSTSASSSFSSDFLAGGTVGYSFGNGWRMEAEFAYQSVERDGRPFDRPSLQGDGNYASTGLAVNALYEFDLFGSPRARTYLGAGLVWLNEVDIDFETAAGEASFSGDDTALQLLAGVRYDLQSDWYLDLGLRQLRASSLRLQGEDGTSGVIRADYEPWAVTLGVGLRF